MLFFFRLTRAMQFGEKIILDCSYDKHMNTREAVNCAKQLMFCFAENRISDEPFDLYFCNANMNGVTMKYLKKHIPTMLESYFPLHVTEKSYLDLFPKEKLVYLTPHCKTDLTEYDSDSIYIIGAMVDTMNNEPLSLAKAKKNGLKMARLPLDRYLQWGAGSGKSLTLNQMTAIMGDIKKTGDWNRSLVHVPRRKIVNESFDDQVEQEKRKWVKSVQKIRLTSVSPTMENSTEKSTGNPFRRKNDIKSFRVSDIMQDDTNDTVNNFRKVKNSS